MYSYFVFITFKLGASSLRCGSQKKQDAASAQHVTENPPSNTQPTGPPRTEGTEGGKNGEKTPDDRIVWFSGVLAGVGVLQFGAMVFQYCAMRKQAFYMRKGLRISLRAADAAKKNAIAAKKSADSLINAERARVIVELKWAVDGYRVQELRELNGTQVCLVRLKLVLTNSGKTPAWVRGTWIRHNVTTVIDQNPDFEFRGNPDSGPEPIAAGGITKGQADLKCSGFADNIPGKDTVIIGGVAEYIDCFGGERFTRFGYILKADGTLERIPDSIYNLFT